MVPEGIEEVELARIEIEALERECKAMAQVSGCDRLTRGQRIEPQRRSVPVWGPG